MDSKSCVSRGAGPFGNEIVALNENEFSVSQVPPGSAVLVGVVAVFNVAGSFCATQDNCTHRQGSLHKGKIDGSTVTCPRHGAQFNICTGAVVRGPAQQPIKTYRVIVDGDIGRIELESPQPSTNEAAPVA